MTTAESSPVHIVPPEIKERFKRFYGKKWRSDESSDSPEESRTSIVRRVKKALRAIPEHPLVLELGSGPQVCTKQLLTTYQNRNDKPPTIITLDIAQILPHKLLARRKPGVFHLLADEGEQPFQDNSFDLVFSNMALDLSGDAGLSETFRVLKPGGRLLVNLHHADLVTEDPGPFLARGGLSQNSEDVLTVFDFMQKTELVTPEASEIAHRFTWYGFQLERLTAVQSTDKEDTWWEVDAVKPAA